MEVPPPNSWRGAFSIASANASMDASSADQRPRHHLHLHGGAGPLRHGDGNRSRRAGADGLQQARIAEGSDVATLLEHEALLADAARGIDGQHQLQIDRRLRPDRHRNREHCGREGEGSKQPRCTRGKSWLASQCEPPFTGVRCGGCRCRTSQPLVRARKHNVVPAADQHDVKHAQELLARQAQRDAFSDPHAEHHGRHEAKREQQQPEIGIDAGESENDDAREGGEAEQGALRRANRIAIAQPPREIQQVDEAAAAEHGAEHPAEKSERDGPRLRDVSARRPAKQSIQRVTDQEQPERGHHRTRRDGEQQIGAGDAAEHHERHDAHKLAARHLAAEPDAVGRRCGAVHDRQQRHDAGHRHRMRKHRRGDERGAEADHPEDDIAHADRGKSQRKVGERRQSFEREHRRVPLHPPAICGRMCTSLSAPISCSSASW